MKNLFKGLSRNTFLLTFTSLFSDIATEMLYPVLPIFLTQVLVAPASVVGIVEGVATATQYLVQGFSGWLSDKLQKPKKIAMIGYFFAAVSKPLVGLSTIWPEVLGARFLDRLSTGVRSAPRDALIAASVEEKNRGKAFGLEGIGDNLGAFLGPLITIALLFALHVQLRLIFYLAFIPGILAFIMMLFVKENKHTVSSSEDKVRIEKSHSTELKNSYKKDFSTSLRMTFTNFPSNYWKYLSVTILFGIGNSSNAFLILRARNLGISLEMTILIYAFFNLVAALSSYPAGTLSDRFGRKNILLFAFLIFIFVYLGFALTTNYLLLATSFILYGAFSGIFRSVGKAFAVDLVPTNLKASGIGWYSTAIGLSGFIASIVAGVLWTNINPQAAFIYGALFALIGTIALLILIPKNVSK